MAEHEHARAGTLSTPITRNEDLAPGRASKSSALDAPAHPLVSGLIARKAERDGNGVADDADQAIATAASSSGMSLPSPIMRKFEASLGTDLSSVRVHTGAASQSAASAVGAKAYTMGQDIHFGAGHYDPSSGAGEHLLAHEVAHTVQQAGGAATRQNKLEVSSPFDPAEHEADAAAAAMVSGRSFAVTSGSGIQRKGYAEDPQHDASVVSGATSFEIKLPTSKPIELGYAELEFSGSFSGKVKQAEEEGEEEAPVEVGPVVGKAGVGVAGEWAVAKERMASAGGWTVKDKPFAVVAQANREEAELAIEGSLTLSNAAVPWLSVTDKVSLVLASVKFADLHKEGVHLAELGLALQASGAHTFADGTQVTVAGTVTATLKPDWKEIAKAIAKEAAKRGGEAASETASETAVTTATATGAGIPLDVAGTALSASAIALPAGVAVLMALGSQQSAGNEEARVAAMKAANAMNAKLAEYVGGYLLVLTGESSTGPGADAANQKITAYMASTAKPRDQACAELLAQAGGLARLRADLNAQTRALLFGQAVNTFMVQFKDKMGLLEELGSYLGGDWGMVSVFKGALNEWLYRAPS